MQISMYLYIMDSCIAPDTGEGCGELDRSGGARSDHLRYKHTCFHHKSGVFKSKIRANQGGELQLWVLSTEKPGIRGVSEVVICGKTHGCSSLRRRCSGRALGASASAL